MLPKFAPLLWITGVVLICVLLFLLPRTPVRNTNLKAPNQALASLDFWLNRALAQVPAPRASTYQQWMRTQQWDSLRHFWLQAKRPDLMARVMELQARSRPSDSLWLQAGKTYYKAVRFCTDSTQLPLLFSQARYCLEQSLAANPKQVEAKLILASCWVDEGLNPMKGIGLLRELEASDSTRTDVQLTLGLMSMRSQQLDKAIKRFKTVLRLDPAFIEAYLHLADAYQQQGSLDLARNALSSYAQLTPNPVEREEIKKYINQLHN
jgi:tetratricopeptide (TPR) repeat protein